MTGRKDARTSQKHLDVLSAFSQKSLVRIYKEFCSPAEAGFPLRSNPDESGSPLRSDKLDAGNALAVRFNEHLYRLQ